MYIAISGLHGSGKSTAAKKVAEQLGWRYYSTGQAFRDMAKERDMSLADFNTFLEDNLEVDRMLDQRMIQTAEKGNVVVDGQVVAYLTSEIPNGLRVLLQCPRKVRVTRMGARDNEGYAEKLHETKTREESERKRFKMLWGVDLRDPDEKLKVYDVILNTGLLDVQTTIQTILTAAHGVFHLSGK